MGIPELLRTVAAKQDGLAQAKRLYRDRLAPDFNPFDFIDPDELRLSGILAWMLNPEATHGQGGRFLRLFLDRLATGWPPEACEQAKVRTESWVEDGRLDLIVSSGSRVFVVENKPWAANQPAQLKRYFAHLDQLTALDSRLNVTDFPLVYLTSDGSDPPMESICEEERCKRIETGQLHCWSYRKHILEWVTECRAVCRADRVSTFIDEFARYIQKNFGEVADVTIQDQLVEEIVSSPAMVSPAMQVAFVADALRHRLLSKLRDQIADSMAKEGWSMDWKVSSARYSGLNIDFSSQFACFFRIEFYKTNFNDLCYGAYMKNQAHSDGGNIRTALLPALSSIGRDEGGTNDAPWVWWRHPSVNDELFPFEPYWGSSPQPWAAIPDGRMASAIIGTALRFRDAFLQLQNGGM